MTCKFEGFAEPLENRRFSDQAAQNHEIKCFPESIVEKNADNINNLVYVTFNGKIERSLRSSIRKNSLTKITTSPLKKSEEKKRKKNVTFSNSHYVRFIENRFTILSENDINELWYNAVEFMNIRISAELEVHYFKLENPQIKYDNFLLKRLWSGTNYDEYKNNIVINSFVSESTLSILGNESRKRFESRSDSVRFTPIFPCKINP